MVPALKAAALLGGRDFVSSEDVAWLAPKVFGHRVEVAPGALKREDLIAACLKKPLEALSATTLTRER
jgi:MoxR-like ATPase